MVKKFVMINELNTKTCSMVAFDIDRFKMELIKRPPSTQIILTNLFNSCSNGKMIVKYNINFTDKIIEYIDYICEVEINNGELINIKPIRSKHEEYLNMEKERNCIDKILDNKLK